MLFIKCLFCQFSSDLISIKQSTGCFPITYNRTCNLFLPTLPYSIFNKRIVGQFIEFISKYFSPYQLHAHICIGLMHIKLGSTEGAVLTGLDRIDS